VYLFHDHECAYVPWFVFEVLFPVRDGPLELLAGGQHFADHRVHLGLAAVAHRDLKRRMCFKKYQYMWGDNVMKNMSKIRKGRKRENDRSQYADGIGKSIKSINKISLPRYSTTSSQN